jgi:low temperature requirement protein LtrA
MFVSLVLAAELPQASEDRGLVIAVGYAVVQGGRSFAAIAFRGDPPQRDFDASWRGAQCAAP